MREENRGNGERVTMVVGVGQKEQGGGRTRKLK